VEALAPATVRALETYLDDRTSGPIFLNRDGGRLAEPTVWRLVRRLARIADIPAANQLSPHSLRHSAITAALNAGVPFRDVQDFADPRTTRRYDRSRHNLDRHATYALASRLGR
jgi:integrase/recombinase XerD